MVQTEGPTFVAFPIVPTHGMGLVWRSTPPEPLIVEAVEPRTWAAQVGFLPGDEILTLNGRRPEDMDEHEFALMMTNRPTRFKLKLRTAQAEALPIGRTDLLRAEVVCQDEDALASAFEGLCGSSGRLGCGGSLSCSSPPAKGHGDSPQVDFKVVHVNNDFHPERLDEVFPSAASVLLMARLAVRFPGPEERSLQQLVEVELMLPSTADARWLADFCVLDPHTADEGIVRVRSPGHPSGLGPVRKNPLF